jgi:ABC-type Zn uptake system ZnuABC Zn-binding protein ZnuA
MRERPSGQFISISAGTLNASHYSEQDLKTAQIGLEIHMSNSKAGFLLRLAIALAVSLGMAFGAAPGDKSRLSVAVAETDIEAIVMAVGGNQVDTFSLFKGCICRGNLKVESTATRHLAEADAVVWTGFLNESAAIEESLRKMQADASAKPLAPVWVDVSKGAVRVNLPTSTCFDYVNAALVSGDPFFWLNPQNGSVIARNVANGLGDLRPERRAYFKANAAAFKKTLDEDIRRWKGQLAGLSTLRVFSTQCGWQNLSKLGGPHYVAYNKTPGSLPDPKLLLAQVKQMRAQVILVDPNTPAEYGKLFRAEPGLTVIDVPSSIEKIQGGKTYNSLFENFVQALLDGTEGPKSSAKM